MYRFLLRPKWIAFTLLVVLLVVVMINLGFWQLRRLDERKDFNAQVRTRAAQPVAELASLGTADVDPESLEWRRVRVDGEYVADEQVLVVNRSQGGVAGRNVVAPLALADGTLVLVNRGFVADTVAVPAPPSGRVTVEGRLRESEERRLGQLTEASDGERVEFQRVDIERIAQQLAGDVQPVFVERTASQPDDPGVLPVPEPRLTEGPHLSYAIQWFIFSTCAVIGWVLAVRRSSRPAAVAPTTEPT